MYKTSFIHPSYFHGLPFCSSLCCCSQLCSVMVFPQVHGESPAFAVGILCRCHHPGCLQTPIQLFWHRHWLGRVKELPLTGATFYHWGIEPVTQSSTLSCWVILTILKHNLHSSLKTLNRTKLQVPIVVTSSKNACLAWLSFLLFTILLHPHTPVLWNYFHNKLIASKPLYQTLVFEGTQDKTFDLKSRLRKKKSRKRFWNWIFCQSDTSTFGGKCGWW